MPYIITVNRPGFMPEQDPYAVATLDDAREAAMNEVRRGTHHGAIDFARDTTEIPESGGIIGPLPDGYVIEVRGVSWPELAAYAGESIGHEPPDDFQAILDTYNGQ